MIRVEDKSKEGKASSEKRKRRIDKRPKGKASTNTSFGVLAPPRWAFAPSLRASSPSIHSRKSVVAKLTNLGTKLKFWNRSEMVCEMMPFVPNISFSLESDSSEPVPNSDNRSSSRRRSTNISLKLLRPIPAGSGLVDVMATMDF